MTRAAGVLVAFTALALGASSQAVGGKVVSTHLESRGLGVFPARHFVRISVCAQIHSKKQACKQGRRAKLYFKRRDKRTLKDTDRSSHHGAVALTGRGRATPDRLIVRVQRKRIDRHERHYTCSSDSLRRFPPHIVPPS